MKLKNLILILLVAGLCFAGISVNSFTVSNNIFQPGATGVATVSVSNPSGSGQASSITMSINAPPEVIVTSTPNMADISAGGSTVVTIPFTVKPDAKPGVYLINVFFSGFVVQALTGQSLPTVNTAAIPVTVVDSPKLSFSISNSTLTGIDNVSIIVSNHGGKATNLKVIIPTALLAAQNSTTASNISSGLVSEIQFYGMDQIFIPEIDENQTIPVSVVLDSRNAPDGPTDVPLLLQYNDELGNLQSDTSSLRVTVRSENLDLGISQMSEIVTKKDSNLTIQIQNNGPDPLVDFRLSFPNSGISLKNQNELKFGDIQPGASVSVSALVSTDLPPGVNTIPSSISWIEKDVQKESTMAVPITVTSDADVGVYLEAKPVPLTTDQDETISVLVSNLGSYSIDNVDVSIDSPAMQSMDISQKQYVGGLQSDDFSTVQFSMHVNATTAGTYPVNITVNYRDLSGDWKQKTFVQDINVFSPAQSQQSPLPIIVGVILIAIAVWFFKFRKKPATQ